MRFLIWQRRKTPLGGLQAAIFSGSKLAGRMAEGAELSDSRLSQGMVV